MTKEQFIKRWRPSHLLMLDLEAVIATEIAKVWELEPVQGIPQPDPTEQPAKPFDKERFERIFCAVVASGVSNNEFITTEEILEELDAYYASKEKGGNNE